MPQRQVMTRPAPAPVTAAQAAAVKAVDQGDYEDSEKEGHQHTGDDRVKALQIGGDQHLPDHQHSQDKGEDSAQARLAGKQEKEGRKAEGEDQLHIQTVMVHHVDREDGVPLIGDINLGFVPRFKDFVLPPGSR